MRCDEGTPLQRTQRLLQRVMLGAQRRCHPRRIGTVKRGIIGTRRGQRLCVRRLHCGAVGEMVGGSKVSMPLLHHLATRAWIGAISATTFDDSARAFWLAPRLQPRLAIAAIRQAVRRSFMAGFFHCTDLSARI